MEKTIISILLLSTLWGNAQNKIVDFDKDIKPLNDKIKSLQTENSNLKIKVNTLSKEISANKLSLDSLRVQTGETSQELGLKISSTEKNTNQKITAVDESLDKNSLYGIIAESTPIIP